MISGFDDLPKAVFGLRPQTRAATGATAVTGVGHISVNLAAYLIGATLRELSGHADQRCGEAAVVCGPVCIVCSGKGGQLAANGGINHEPSHCRRGMWLHPRRMLRLHAEPGLLQIVAADRGVADRVRAAGRRGEDLAGPDLPHALRADRARRRRDVGDDCAQRLPAADRAVARGPAPDSTKLSPNPVYVELQTAPPRRRGRSA